MSAHSTHSHIFFKSSLTAAAPSALDRLDKPLALSKVCAARREAQEPHCLHGRSNFPTQLDYSQVMAGNYTCKRASATDLMHGQVAEGIY